MKEKKHILNLSILFLLWPFAAFVVALKNYSIKYYKIFIVAFGFFYGYTFVPIPNSDITRHVQKFINACDLPFGENFNTLITIYSEGSVKKDIYLDLMIFVTSVFTSNPNMFLGLVGLVYFWVFVTLIDKIISLSPNYKGRYFQFFLLGCIFIYSLSAGINGIRFPLAFLVFSYGTLNYLIHNKFKYVLLGSLSILIHIALLYLVVFLLLFYLVRPLRHSFLLFILLLLSSLFSVFVSDILSSSSNVLGSLFETKYEAYTQSGFVDRRVSLLENWNWYVQLRHLTNYYFPAFVILIVYLFRKHLIIDELGNRILAFSTLLLVASFISGGILDTTTNRYMVFSLFFSLILLFYLGPRNINSLITRSLSLCFSFIVMLNILIIFRADLSTMSPVLLFGNPFVSMFVEFDQSIQDLLLK